MPITMTSVLPPSMLPNRGLWGGLIVLGNGCISKTGGTNTIEGLTAPDGTYGGGGGCNNADNSGTLQYVRVWYGGADVTGNAVNNPENSGNEINGMTFGGVGSGTTLDHCEVACKFMASHICYRSGRPNLTSRRYAQTTLTMDSSSSAVLWTESIFPWSSLAMMPLTQMRATRAVSSTSLHLLERTATMQLRWTPRQTATSTAPQGLTRRSHTQHLSEVPRPISKSSAMMLCTSLLSPPSSVVPLLSLSLSYERNSQELKWSRPHAPSRGNWR